MYRLYRAEGLSLRHRRPKRNKAARLRQPKQLVSTVNEIWSMDFVSDALYDGRRLRALTVVDTYTRECLAIEVGQSLKGDDVVRVLDGLTALHFINDWNKSIFMHGHRPFRGRSLVDNIGLVMSYGNDVSFQHIFVEQLRNILLPGDLVIAISGRGNSANVIRAVKYANESGAVSLGLCGYDGGKLKDLAQHCVWAKVNDMQLAEDVYAIFGHIVPMLRGKRMKEAKFWWRR